MQHITIKKIDLISNVITSDLKQRVDSIGRVYEPLNKSMLGFVTILSPVAYELICKTMNHMIAKEGGDLVKLIILTWLFLLLELLFFSCLGPPCLGFKHFWSFLSLLHSTC